MRFARFVPLALAAAMPLPAQTAPLAATFIFVDGAHPVVSLSKPAYFVILDVSRSAIGQIYPLASSQWLEAGQVRPLTTIQVGGRAAPYGGRMPRYVSYRSMYGAAPGLLASDGPHTLLLVASTAPLRIQAPFTTAITLPIRLENRGYAFNFTSDAAIDSLVGLVEPADPSAEVAVDAEPYYPTSAIFASLAYGFGYPGLGSMPALYPLCVNGLQIDPSQTMLPGVVPACVPSPHLPRSPVPPDTIKRTDTVAVTSAGVVSGINEGKITDPAEIRRFYDRVVEAERAAAGGAAAEAPRVGGAATAARHADSNDPTGNGDRTMNAPGAAARAAPSGGQSHERTPAPENRRRIDAPDSPRTQPAPRAEIVPSATTAPAPTPPPAAPASGKPSKPDIPQR